MSPTAGQGPHQGMPIISKYLGGCVAIAIAGHPCAFYTCSYYTKDLETRRPPVHLCVNSKPQNRAFPSINMSPVHEWREKVSHSLFLEYFPLIIVFSLEIVIHTSPPQLFIIREL